MACGILWTNLNGKHAEIYDILTSMDCISILSFYVQSNARKIMCYGSLSHMNSYRSRYILGSRNLATHKARDLKGIELKC